MSYWQALFGLSLAFVVLERLWPRWPAQRLWRPGIVTDLVYMVLNGHFLGVALAWLAAPLVGLVAGLLAAQGLEPGRGLVSGLGFWSQLTIAFFCLDLLQWSIHNLLHRVPFLWELHKVHHSIEHMDFWGSMRFHFGEVLVYKGLLYAPLLMLGFAGPVLLWLAVISTAIGHLNHANLRLRLGPVGYVLNGPEMHVWHHAHPSVGPLNVNFAINLALWDWLFGTAYLPTTPGPPARLGFADIERFPADPLRQELWPLSRSR
jgi:sterol desaturase/sphingolipid hydroxylase (fatty acid hydroxylase superfamily)